MAKKSPVKFAKEVSAEARRVVWPTRRETIVTTIMVFIMATLAAIFFLLADKVFSWGVGLLLGI
ncbi:MAG: preprotein translocase subunit SecE [Rhizobiales bacterium]|nr:preprotein translocase subunit SecE [Hyphomicrobiales bacterium]NRB13721.1 preprotein translocase subunit SecE [Hyphomicrobiales bacterium]